MSSSLLVVVGATGAQGRSVVHALSSTYPSYNVRALTSNTTTSTAIELSKITNISVVQANLDSVDNLVAAFKDATHIFANTVFNTDVFTNEGPEATEKLEAQRGLNIMKAASETASLKHFVWSGLPDAVKISNGKYHIPHFQSKISAETFAKSSPHLSPKLTVLYVGLYGSNLSRSIYRPVPINAATDGTYALKFTLPCPPSTSIPFIGDETHDVGLIVRSIFTQPSKTLGRTVLGAAEIMNCDDWAAATQRALQRQGKRSTVAYEECPLKEYEEKWGAFGTEIGLMMAYFGEFEEKGWGEGVMRPMELGVEGFKGTEERLAGMEWEDFA